MLDMLTMGKLNRICRSHGWEVSYNQLSVIGGSSDQYEVEINHDRQFLGKANLRLLDPSKENQFEFVKELVNLYLEPKLYQQFLRNQEQSINQEISWGRNFNDLTITDNELLEQKVLNHLFSVCESSHYSSKKFADEIHDMKSNWALLEQGPISIDSADELIKLGPVTWYIPQPTAKEIEVINTYLSRKSDINEWATIILGSNELNASLNAQKIDLGNMPLQTGLRKDVLKLLLGLS